MKRLYFLPFILIALLILVAYSGKDAKWPGTAPAGYTGSPGDSKDCTDCHGGTATNVDGWITINIMDFGYEPGFTYTITATAYGQGGKGFLIAPQDFNGNLVGELIVGPETQLVGDGEYMSHEGWSNPNPKVWTFEWTAPEAGFGPVTFYGAFTTGMPNTKLASMTVPERQYVNLEEKMNATTKVYPNPVTENVNVQLSLDEAQNVLFELYDLSGRKVNQLWEEHLQAGNNTVRINKDLSAYEGVYILQIRTSEVNLHRKIIIQ